LARERANFTWHVALSAASAADEWSGPTGYIHEVVRDAYLSGHPDPAGCEYYLCGPPMMLRACRAMLSQLGVPAEQIFFDDFGI
jgi:Na+-transporting NADH:ubiquinone oxidoreductase subunit F